MNAKFVKIKCDKEVYWINPFQVMRNWVENGKTTFLMTDAQNAYKTDLSVDELLDLFESVRK